jgi:dolichol-phosphate mannosyltransferase
MSNSVTSAIVIPSYNETLALPQLLRELKVGLTDKDAVIVMDDSPRKVAEIIEKECRDAIIDTKFIFIFDNSGNKSGRGASVRRGMMIALMEYPNIEYVLECDADGSHQPIDILKIKNSRSRSDLLVGSRYLPSSKIVGWPLSRRIFSFILNKFIPSVTSVKLNDITNGLRRYSRECVLLVLSEPQINTGFIYLTEQAILVTKRRMSIDEEAIIFVDRTLGRSTVTWKELRGSLFGIIQLVRSNRNL